MSRDIRKMSYYGKYVKEYFCWYTDQKRRRSVQLERNKRENVLGVKILLMRGRDGGRSEGQIDSTRDKALAIHDTSPSSMPPHMVTQNYQE